MNSEHSVLQFCDLVEVPRQIKCKDCQGVHYAITYDTHNEKNDDGSPSLWFSVGYGRCDAMKEETDNLYIVGPVHPTEREEIRKLYRDLHNVEVEE